LKPTIVPSFVDACERHTDVAPGLAARLVLAVVAVYKIVFSPLFAGSCRFSPGCANYMAEAVRVHGAWRGGVLGLMRLSRCHPFGGSGFDPVPPASRRGTHPGGAQVASSTTEDQGSVGEPGNGTAGRGGPERWNTPEPRLV
jgi:uncharacterized protein